MCGRFASPEEKAILSYWHIGRHNNNPFPRRFNVFPTDTIPFIRRPSNAEELELAAGRWGLVPHWWKEAKPPKTSFIARADGALFGFAGLMSYRKDPKTGEALRSCAIVTTQAAGLLAQIHERAPLVLSESAQNAWLDRRLVDARQVTELVRSRLPPEAFTHYKVRLLVNNAKADGQELIEPLEE